MSFLIPQNTAHCPDTEHKLVILLAGFVGVTVRLLEKWSLKCQVSVKVAVTTITCLQPAFGGRFIIGRKETGIL